MISRWEQIRQKLIEIQIKTRKWRWIGHALRKTEAAVEKQALDWIPQGVGRRGRPRITWKRSIGEEIRGKNKTWRGVKAIATQRERWKSFTNGLCSKRNDRNYVKVVKRVLRRAIKSKRHGMLTESFFCGINARPHNANLVT